MGKRPVQQIKIFDVNVIFQHCVMAVKPMLDEMSLVDLVEDPVGVVFGACCKDYQFELFLHFFEEGQGVGADHVIAAVFVFTYFVVEFSSLLGAEVSEVNQSLV